MSTLFNLGTFLCSFLVILLLSKKNKAVSDIILAVLLFFAAVYLVSYHLYYLGNWIKYPHLVGITHPFPLLYGPLLFLYVVFSLRKDQKMRWRDLLHILPFVLSYLYMMFFYFFSYSAVEKAQIDSGISNAFRGFMMLSLVAFIISGVVYPVLSYRLVGKHSKLIRDNFSYEKNISLQWLRFLILGLGGIYITVAIISFLKEGIKVDFGFNTDLVFFFLLILFIFFIGYFGIRQEGIFAAPQKLQQIVVPEESVNEYRKSGLKEEDALVLHKRLLHLMQVKKPYLEPRLTLGSLAEQLSILPNYLSQAINQHEGKNFYDFVNSYRVQEFIDRISQPENSQYNIMSLAYDSGFNSKSSFNQVFKKHTGKTPSQYMQDMVGAATAVQ